MLTEDLQRAIDMLREGLAVPDRCFDQLYPEEIQRRSSEFWTPVIVALRAARELTARGARNILDVGAGVGKLCILGALSTEATFTGIEQRAHLVEAGHAAIAALGVPRVHLFHGTLSTIDFDAYDGFYLYNPFEENTLAPDRQLDQTVPLSPSRFLADVALVEQALARAKAGTRVVTFNGFGGELPPTYRALPEATRRTALLRFFEQTEPAPR